MVRFVMVRCSLLALCMVVSGFAGDEQFNGKWVIDAEPPHARALWLHVTGAGTDQLAGRFVGGVAGRSQPLIDAKIVDGELSFRSERYLEDSKRWLRATTSVRVVEDDPRGEDDPHGKDDPRGKHKLARGDRPRSGDKVSGDKVGRDSAHGGYRLLGTTRRDGDQIKDEIKWVGRPSEAVADRDDGSWREGEPVVLFDGADLSAWHGQSAGGEKTWRVDKRILRNSDHGDMLVSNEKFWNFKLHVEYNVAPHSNSGIGLRSRYEVQILDDHGQPASIHGNGAVYSTIKPGLNASLPADSWQTFDITLIGRDVTIVLNGKTTIDKQVIEALTAIATDSNEREAGPITLQGDHGPIAFRSIVVTPLVK